MGSSSGGFLLGVGVSVLIFCVGFYIVLDPHYSQIMAWSDDVEQIYEITHSSSYESTLEALETVSPYLYQISNALNNPLISYLNLGWLSDSLTLISEGYSYMDQLYDLSETAYQSSQQLGTLHQSLGIISIAGVLLCFFGIALISGSKKRVEIVEENKT